MASLQHENKSQTTLRDQETRQTTPVPVAAEKDVGSSSSSSHHGEHTAVANTPKDDLDVVNEKKEIVPEGNGEPVYITGLPFWSIIVALCLAVFVLAIGTMLHR